MHGYSSKEMIYQDLQNTPLGQGTGQLESQLSAPFNARSSGVRVYVINHSAEVERRAVKVGVSQYRGAREALKEDQNLRKDFTVQSLQDEAKKGQDMNIYHDVCKPVVYKITFDNRSFIIPPAECTVDDKGNYHAVGEPQAHLVPEGVWDLFLGNYDRMHSTEKDVASDEANRLATAWFRRRNPVLRITVDGVTKTKDNPFGFLEFRRFVEAQAPQQIDKEFLTAMDLQEA